MRSPVSQVIRLLRPRRDCESAFAGGVSALRGLAMAKQSDR